MSEKHLSAGSEQPPRAEGKLRLYSMRFCPYVQRVRLVLDAKGVAYDVVNVDLKRKPEWLRALHPDGKVPALDTGGRVLIESLDIADHLDEEYPQPALYPQPERRAQDKQLIDKFGKVIGAFTRALYDKENKPLKSFLDEILGTLHEFEDELAKRGTTFFSGDQPGMVDYMMWPWAERSKLPVLLRNEQFNFPKGQFPKLVAWRQAMLLVEPVKATAIDVDTHVRFARGYLHSDCPDYLDEEF